MAVVAARLGNCVGPVFIPRITEGVFFRLRTAEQERLEQVLHINGGISEAAKLTDLLDTQCIECGYNWRMSWCLV